MKLLPILVLALSAAAPLAAQAPALPPRSAEDIAAANAFDALPKPEQAARLAAAERLLTASGFDDQTRKSLATSTQFMLPLFIRGNEARRDELRRIVTDEFLSSTDKMVPLLRERAARRHAELLTAAELDQLAVIYSSPIGKRLQEVTPALASRLMRDGGEIGQAAFQTALPRIIDRLKAANMAVPTQS